MKMRYKLSLLAIGIVAFSSCEKHDPFDDKGTPGQLVPTTYWEVGSTAVKAGESFSFKGQYYTEHGQVPLRSEVWYSVEQADEVSASLKLAGDKYSYTQTVAFSEQMRSSQCAAEFDHSLAEWDGYEFIITGNVPTSSTLAPVNWMPKGILADWDQVNYDRYFPENFADSFMTVVKENLIKETGNFPTALKNVYVGAEIISDSLLTVINEDFLSGMEESKQFPMPTEKVGNTKSDHWHLVTDAMQPTERRDKVVGYQGNAGGVITGVDFKALDKKAKVNIGTPRNPIYENQLEGNDSLLHDAMTKQNPNVLTVTLDGYADDTWYAVFASSPWLYCRYEANAASILTAVRDEYMDAVKAILDAIPFYEWVYDSPNTKFAVTATRKYTLTSCFKVVDTDGNVGKASTEYSLTVN